MVATSSWRNSDGDSLCISDVFSIRNNVSASWLMTSAVVHLAGRGDLVNKLPKLSTVGEFAKAVMREARVQTGPAFSYESSVLKRPLASRHDGTVDWKTYSASIYVRELNAAALVKLE